MKYISQKELQERLKPIDFKALIAKETNGRLRIMPVIFQDAGSNR